MNDRLNFVKGVLIALPISLALWWVIYIVLLAIYNWVVAATGTT